MNMPAKIMEVPMAPNLNDIEGDRFLIGQTAHHLEKHVWDRMNAADCYIRAGAELALLHKHLSKNSRSDKTRIGWKKAFTASENKFGFSRQQAEKYIIISKVFSHGATVVAPSKLPQSLNALLALAKSEMPTQTIQSCIVDHSIKPTSTASEINKLAIKLGLLKKPTPRKTGTAITKDAPKRQRIKAALDFLAGLNLTIDDLES